MLRYQCWNGPMPTTAVQASVTTGTAITTQLQIATPSTRQALLLEWGYSLSAAPAGLGRVELLQTDVAATVTAHVASGVQPLDPNAPPSLMTLGVAATGYTASAEGAITATRLFDHRQIPITAGSSDLSYVRQWVGVTRPIIGVSKFIRIRTNFAAAVNIVCWATWDE